MTPPARAVVDANVAIKWVVAEPDSNAARTLSTSRLLAPELFDAECANILWVKARHGEMTFDSAAARLRLLLGNPLQRVAHQALMPRAFDLARELDHPIYDCIYLSLAVQEGTALVTADQRFVRKAAASRHATLVVPLSNIR